MVQRKSPSKLGIQAASQKHDKPEKRSTAVKPATTQAHDMRNKGASELKKKIKKSRSFKRSDLESLGSSSSVTPAKLRIHKPVMETSSPGISPQNQSMIKVSSATPNYMKPTTSSDAKKEQRSQVSHCQTSPHSRISSGRNTSCSKHSASGHKPARALTKQSSLKPVRTLTKTSSFKMSRPSIKKSSRVALCPSLDVGRATCSSTLKDSKLPAFLILNPGGTEAQGTSVPRVCPYNYCSLNGHHHAPVPPLKRFLSMRRRLLKTQKSKRLRSLSPLRKKSSRGGKKGSDTGQLDYNRDPTIQDAMLASSEISPLMDESDTDFFVEIYAKPRDETAESIGRSILNGDEEAIIDFSLNPEDLDDVSMLSDRDEAEAENYDGKVDESFTDDSPHSEISFEVDLSHNGDVLMGEMDTPMASPGHDQFLETEVDDYQLPLVQSQTGMGYCCIETKLEFEIPAETELIECVSEVTDMDCGEVQAAIPHIDFHQEIPKVGELQEFCKENESYLNELGDSGSELNGGDQNLEGDASSDVSAEGSDGFEGLNREAGVEESTIVNGEKGEDTQPDIFISIMESATSEVSLVEPIGSCEEKNGEYESGDNFLKQYSLPKDGEPMCTTNVECEAVEEIDENSSEDAGNALDFETSESIDLEDVAKSSLPLDDAVVGADVQGVAGGKVEDANNLETVKEDCNENHQIQTEIDAYKLDVTTEDEKLLPLETQDHSSDDQSYMSDVLEEQKLSEKVQGVGGKFGITSSRDSEEDNDSKRNKHSSTEESEEDKVIQVRNGMELDETKTFPMENNNVSLEEDKLIINSESSFNQQLPKACRNLRGTVRRKRPTEDEEEPRKFNPRGPNFLPLEPDPEAEKVDLRHQMMDERKSAEEWMVDYALQQAVKKLAPSRSKRRVAVLVQAFEAVTPVPIQACS
ncbi:PREDICTED: uncharacterized protein LOC104608867 [Nelumbo nucifera]|uniref:Uncharacterized protein LOC104608867 n=1 Tax=Nelumbo nucifera TaxID=4432 RepID=A0A1U8BAW5_NELNU|nr:PREDICTED: uncharacterized protein LOC104608867 [Nelumbo nucifera]